MRPAARGMYASDAFSTPGRQKGKKDDKQQRHPASSVTVDTSRNRWDFIVAANAGRTLFRTAFPDCACRYGVEHRASMPILTVPDVAACVLMTRVLVSPLMLNRRTFAGLRGSPRELERCQGGRAARGFHLRVGALTELPAKPPYASLSRTFTACVTKSAAGLERHGTPAQSFAQRARGRGSI